MSGNYGFIIVCKYGIDNANDRNERASKYLLEDNNAIASKTLDIGNITFFDLASCNKGLSIRPTVHVYFLSIITRYSFDPPLSSQ